jgi:protein-disulfide isomerase
MSIRIVTALALCGLVASSALAEPQPTTTKPQAAPARAAPRKAAASETCGRLPPARTIATVDGKKITYAEIEATVGSLERQAEVEYQEKVYQLRSGALDQLIAMRIVEGEARKAGTSTTEWLDREFLSSIPEPAEAAVAEAYEQNRAQLDGVTLEQARPQLVEHLRRAEGQRRFPGFLQGLVDRHDVKNLLVAPEPLRVAVAPVGPSRGPEKAKITIVEFSDFECPFCSRGGATLAKVMERYPDQVRVVYRQFPLEFHPRARKAAEASLCAGEQGKFWELHDRMFADQGKLAVEDLKAAARELKLDGVRFDACLDAGAQGAAVEADLKAGQALGVQGTPAFFVNGVFLNGAVPFEQFVAAIDRELKRG